MKSIYIIIPQLLLALLLSSLYLGAQTIDAPIVEEVESNYDNNHPGEIILLEEGMSSGYIYVEYGSVYKYPENHVGCEGKFDGRLLTSVKKSKVCRVLCAPFLHEGSLKNNKVTFQMTRINESDYLEHTEAYDISFYSFEEAKAIKNNFTSGSKSIDLKFPLDKVVGIPLGFNQEYSQEIVDKVSTPVKGKVAGFFYGSLAEWLQIKPKDKERFALKNE